jgi:hypothetical protein
VPSFRKPLESMLREPHKGAKNRNLEAMRLGELVPISAFIGLNQRSELNLCILNLS